MKNKEILSVVSFEKQKKKDKAFALIFCLTFVFISYIIITKL